MKNISYLFRVLTTPKCWIRLGPTSSVLDDEVNKALDNPNIVIISKYLVNLNGISLWIENFPYAFGSIDGNDSLGLPSRRTVFRLYDEVVRARIKENLK